MSDKKHWIFKIVPTLAFAAGIIMASIGGIMILSSGMKLLLFDHNPYDQVTREDCEYDYQDLRAVPVMLHKTREPREIETGPRKRTEEEIQKCMSERKAEVKLRFQEGKQQNLVDGLSALVVGLILILAFRKREE